MTFSGSDCIRKIESLPDDPDLPGARLHRVSGVQVRRHRSMRSRRRVSRSSPRDSRTSCASRAVSPTTIREAFQLISAADRVLSGCLVGRASQILSRSESRLWTPMKTRSALSERRADHPGRPTQAGFVRGAETLERPSTTPDGEKRARPERRRPATMVTTARVTVPTPVQPPARPALTLPDRPDILSHGDQETLFGAESRSPVSEARLRRPSQGAGVRLFQKGRKFADARERCTLEAPDPQGSPDLRRRAPRARATPWCIPKDTDVSSRSPPAGIELRRSPCCPQPWTR